MNETTDIEKKSLEAHVELCAERYRFLEHKLAAVDDKITALEDLIKEVHEAIQQISSRRSDQIIQWGLGMIMGLIGCLGYLLSVYVLK